MGKHETGGRHRTDAPTVRIPRLDRHAHGGHWEYAGHWDWAALLHIGLRLLMGLGFRGA